MVQDPTRALTIPGRLVIGPTNGGMLGGVYPYGSTAPVGIVTRSKLTRTNQIYLGNSEARGVDGASAYRGREKAAFSAVLIQYDPTILNKLYASNTVSPNSFAGANTLSLPQPGRNLAPGLVEQGSPLLFAADDPTHPSLLILAPQYLIALEAKQDLDRTLNKPYEIGFVLVCGLDANGYDFREDLLENLSLT